MTKFLVGELWADEAGFPVQRVIAVTNHALNPRVVTQAENGVIWDYDLNGRAPGHDRRYDLTRRIPEEGTMLAVEGCKLERFAGMGGE